MHPERGRLFFVNEVPINVKREVVAICPSEDLERLWQARSIPGILPSQLEPMLPFLDGATIIGSWARAIYLNAFKSLGPEVGIPRKTVSLVSDLDANVNLEQIDRIRGLGCKLERHQSLITDGVCFCTDTDGQKTDFHLLNPGEDSLRKALLHAPCPQMAVVAKIVAVESATRVMSPFHHGYLPGEQLSFGERKRAQLSRQIFKERGILNGSLWDIPDVVSWELAQNGPQRARWFLARRFMTGILADSDFYWGVADLFGGEKAWVTFRQLVESNPPFTKIEVEALKEKGGRLVKSFPGSITNPRVKILLEQSGISKILPSLVA